MRGHGSKEKCHAGSRRNGWSSQKQWIRHFCFLISSLGGKRREGTRFGAREKKEVEDKKRALQHFGQIVRGIVVAAGRKKGVQEEKQYSCRRRTDKKKIK